MKRTALELPPEQRLELARALVESIHTPEAVESAVEEAVQRLDEIVRGKVQPMTEEEYRRAVE